ncbi:MAG: long-chain fatty acid--CoA ligase [Proteobacteria bacterium]|nr:long-chain fatty acid--CoA ligase [Pseudomonadota bacterium]
MQLTLSLTRAARLFPDHTATVFEDRTRNWREVEARVARLGAGLRELGVQTGDRVAVLAHSSDRFFEATFAILFAGGIFTPLSTRATPGEIGDLLEDCGARVIFVGKDFHGFLPEIEKHAPTVIALDEDAPDGLLQHEALIETHAPGIDAKRHGNDLAAIYYTGGTTGRAKGVMLSHDNLYANAMQSLSHFRYDERTVYLHSGPLYHLAAGSRLFTNTLLAATHVFIPRFSPEAVIEAIETHRITMTALVPTMMGMLVHHPDFEKRDLSTLDLITYGGSPIAEALLAELIEKLPHVRFGQAYGMTELSPACTYLEPRDHTLNPATRHRLRSAGRPAIGCDIRIVDAHDNDVPVGERGEIIVAGPVVMQGYWKRPEMTAEALRGGYMHTGDIGAYDADGFLYVLDRLKDMIVSGGENIYTLEIEDCLRKHPDVAFCAVIGVPHEKWGEAVHAVIQPRADAAPEAAALEAHCRAHLASFKVPRSFEFIDQMPLSAANKILKSELRKRHWAGHERMVG